MSVANGPDMSLVIEAHILLPSQKQFIDRNYVYAAGALEYCSLLKIAQIKDINTYLRVLLAMDNIFTTKKKKKRKASEIEIEIKFPSVCHLSVAMAKSTAARGTEP